MIKRLFSVQAVVLGTLILAFGLYRLINAWNRYELEHPCLRGHVETVVIPPSTTYIQAGNVMIPMYNPGYSYESTVCDERK